MVTHPYSIYIWQPRRRGGGSWIEPLQIYSEQYALYVAQLIHQDTHSVLKVVRYGVAIAWFPDPETVEKIERYIARQKKINEEMNKPQ